MVDKEMDEKLGNMMAGRFNDDDDDSGGGRDRDRSRGSAVAVERDDGGDGAEAESPRDLDGEGPAFAHADTTQESVYVRPGTWRRDYSAARSDVDSLARRDFGITDVEKREIDDAALRAAAENPDVLLYYVLEARGIDPEDHEE